MVPEREGVGKAQAESQRLAKHGMMPESVALEGFSSFVFQTRDTEIVEERECVRDRADGVRWIASTPRCRPNQSIPVGSKRGVADP